MGGAALRNLYAAMIALLRTTRFRAKRGNRKVFGALGFC
jgi:hypothetical protein